MGENWKRVALRVQEGLESTIGDSYAKMLAFQANYEALLEAPEPVRFEGEKEADFGMRTKEHQKRKAQMLDGLTQSRANIRKLVGIYDRLVTGKLTDIPQLAVAELFDGV